MLFTEFPPAIWIPSPIRDRGHTDDELASPSGRQTPTQKLPSGCNEPTSMCSKVHGVPDSAELLSLAKYRLAESLSNAPQAMQMHSGSRCMAMGIQAGPWSGVHRTR